MHWMCWIPLKNCTTKMMIRKPIVFLLHPCFLFWLQNQAKVTQFGSPMDSSFFSWVQIAKCSLMLESVYSPEQSFFVLFCFFPPYVRRERNYLLMQVRNSYFSFKPSITGGKTIGSEHVRAHGSYQTKFCPHFYPWNNKQAHNNSSVCVR